MFQSLGIIREFQTANYRVIVDAVEEFSPDLSWDESGEVSKKVNRGEYVVFCARARVIHKQLGELASDYLGNCIYESFEAFADHRECGRENRRLRAEGSSAICGSYFADMITTVCQEARKEVAHKRTILGSLKLREV